MTVYFAQGRTDQRTVKIGFTSDLEKRKQNLSVALPGGITILAALPGNKETEAYLHDKFANHRLSGEWFTFSEEIRDFIRDFQNGKRGMVPFRDTVVYMRRSTAQYATEAVELAREMARAIINAELRGLGDTANAAINRLSRRTGFARSAFTRLLYKPLNDIRAGEYLHLKAILDDLGGRNAALMGTHEVGVGKGEDAPVARTEE